MAKQILVVDDDPDITTLLQARLQANGYHVTTAGDGTSALKKIRESAPDLIILDMMMPDIQGSTLCSSLKADDKYQFIPVIILTARNNEYDRELVRTIKADAYFSKPFDPEKLLKKIKDLVS